MAISTVSASLSVHRFPAKSSAAMASFVFHISKTKTPLTLLKINRRSFSFASVTNPTTGTPYITRFQVRSVAATAEAVAGFDEMSAGTQRKYYMLGGKGGVGKTSCAASLADLTGGMLVPVDGLESPLFALEINPEKAREEFRSASQKNGGTGVKDFMDSMGLGMLVDQLGELKLGELLDTPPPGLDEALAISKVMQFVEAPEYSMFTRIVFDTAPTGHTLRLLSLPDFLDASIGKILKLKQKLALATSAIKSVFGKEEKQEDASDKLEKLRERMKKVRDLFRDTDSTEFVIVTIPTVMAISESSRLHSSLKKESVPVQRLIVNQVLPPSASDCKFCAMKRKDQNRALEMIGDDPELSGLRILGNVVGQFFGFAKAGFDKLNAREALIGCCCNLPK
ncbi:hypothetical protein Syun_000869 [Stephania yunnanensis]|uniref:ArsA/GET3 Anion-transporting ATPase-like domain-containing protein n=1 Tax=Stephania yunnanensis TaxID=152371 RepID=A0AAP0Q768_9MAGN